MSEKLDRLKDIMGEIYDLRHAAALLSWDQQTYMPAGGNEARGHQLGTLGKTLHNLATSEEVGRLLSDLKEEFAGASEDSDEAALIRVATRDYNKATCIPEEF